MERKRNFITSVTIFVGIYMFRFGCAFSVGSQRLPLRNGMGWDKFLLKNTQSTREMSKIKKANEKISNATREKSEQSQHTSRYSCDSFGCLELGTIISVHSILFNFFFSFTHSLVELICFNSNFGWFFITFYPNMTFFFRKILHFIRLNR